MKTKGVMPNVSRWFEWLTTPHSPLRIMGTVTLAVFIGETLVMIVFPFLPPMSIIGGAIVDSTLLIVVISPALYLFLFRPIIRHIQQREEAERNLRKNRDLLQRVFNGISDPLILLDEKMRVKMINSAASRYYNIGDQLPIDQPCHRALMATEKPCEECDILARISKNGTETFERRGLFDRNRIEQVVIYRSMKPSGEPGSIIIKISDVTAARTLERKMQERERLASLGLLISGVAHEINNPNTFISFNLPILKDYMQELIPIVDRYAGGRSSLEIANMPYAEFKTDLFKLIENITHGSRRINTIVSQLKDFSRIQDDQRLDEVYIDEVIDRVNALAQSQIKRMVKRFDMSIARDLPSLVTDSQAVEQVVMNMLINAGQAADKSDSWVRLKVDRIDDSQYVAAIEIADNGCGIDDETRKHIFDPLFTTKGPNKGTGLGLYICHNLAEGIGGHITVHSVPGEGSTFRLMLPDLRNKRRPERLLTRAATRLDPHVEKAN